MPAQVAAGSPTAPAEALRRAVEEDGGQVLAVFRDPLGGNWQILAALPIDKVQPTPYQRDLSESHVKRLTAVLDALDRFLDPIIAVRGAEGGYWTPNGNHRLAALRGLGGRSILALVLADPEVAYKILALNTEKAHNLREKSLEVIRMARDLGRAARRDGEGLRARVRGARVPDARRLLREERPLRGRRIPPRAQADRRLPGWAARPLPGDAGGARRQGARARRGRRRGHEGAQGARLREPLPAPLRRRAHQPAAVPARGKGCQGRQTRFRRDAREDALRPPPSSRPSSVKPEHLARAGGAADE